MAGDSAREVARRSREKAERLQRRAEMFERGAAGESATADVLSGLPAGWTVLNDVRWPGRRLANIDHVVLGPSGIFVIDSKNWSGRVTLIDGVLRQNGRRRDTDVASAADGALAVAQLVGPHAEHVHPVLCFVGQDHALAGWAREVMVCSLANLQRMLLTRPAAIVVEGQRDAWMRLDAQLRSAAAGPTTPPPAKVGRTPVQRRAAWPAHIPRPGPRRRSRGNQPSVSRFLIGVGLAIALLAFGPKIAPVVGGVVAELLTSQLASPDCSDDARSRRC